MDPMPFLLAAYAISAVTLGGVILWTMLGARATARRLKVLEANNAPGDEGKP
jgi:heme exporter protein CcmD